MQSLYRNSSWVQRLLPIVRSRFYSKDATEPTSADKSPESPDVRVWEERVVAGLQPSGELHVGNYFGCVRRLVTLQDAGRRCIVFAADLHALTAKRVVDLQARTRSLVTLLVASGLDSRTVLFAQSAVPRHADLCWALACLCTTARLEALPQYRERRAAQQDTLAPLLYPVLQTADILLYRGTHVVIGADQQRHVQLAAALVKTFHHTHGKGVFPTPQAILPDNGAERILSLRDPSKKMSKSDPNDKSRILVTDSEDTIKLKMRKAVTDCESRVTYDPQTRPGVSNLINLHCLASDVTPEEVVEESDSINTGQYKSVVSEALCKALRGVRQRFEELEQKPRIISSVLEDGAARAQELADQTYEDVANKIGLTTYRPWLGQKQVKQQNE